MLVMLKNVDGKEVAINTGAIVSIESVRATLSGAFQTQITLPYREPIFAQGSVEDVVEAINRVYNIDSEVMEATRDLVMSADHFLTNAKERDEAGPGQFADSDGLPTYKGEAMYPDYYAMQVAVDFLADRLELPRHAVESEDDGE